MVAASFIDFFWSILIVFFMIIYFMMLFQVVIDVFRRDDASGVKKALWLIALLVAPLLGLLVYLIVNADGMTRRGIKDVRESQAAFDDYIRSTAGTGGPAAEIEKAKSLLDSGAITQSEYEALKQKALSA